MVFDPEMDSTLKLVRFYAPRDLKLVRGEGQYVWDVNGRRYLDCHTAHGVAFLGHRNPWVIQELKRQLDELITASPIFATEVMEEAVKLLEKILPKNLRYFYMLNGGSEGVELALKAARKLTGRTRFISFINGFHGRTMGALAVTWNPRYRKGYDPFPWDVEFLPYNDASAVEREVNDSVAAVIVEPVQGEGGLSVASPEFLKAIRNSCDQHGALMIIDEVQSGFGRTGILWAHERANIKPDIMVAGKSLGGGFPLSVVAFSEELGSELKGGDHGSTFGGNPLALAALRGGIKALLEDRVVEKASEAGKILMKTLEELVSRHELATRGIRGLGLMAGIELRTNPTKAIQMLQEKGVLALRAGLTVLRFLPPYLITKEDIETLRQALDEVLTKVRPGG